MASKRRNMFSQDKKQETTEIGMALVSDKGECQQDFECDMELSICVNSTCVCPPGYVRNSDMTKCLEGANGFGAKCVDSLQCSYNLKSGGYCSNGTCGCTQNYHYLRGRCWKTSGLNDTCHSDENCFVNYNFESAICNQTSKRCECAQGYYQREYSSCRKISGPGGPCGIPLDCMNCPDAVCTKKRICQCSGSNANQTASHNLVGDNLPVKSHRLIRSFTSHIKIGSECGSDNDCVGKNMMCEIGKKWCTCKMGFVAAEGNRMCEKLNILEKIMQQIMLQALDRCSVRIVNVLILLGSEMYSKVGEACFNNKDCGTNANIESCINGVCTCAPGYHKSGKGYECRIDSKKVGDDCGEDTDCLFPNARCSNTTHKCACLQHYIEKDGACISSKCTTDKDCSEVSGSLCKNEVGQSLTCQCSTDDLVPSKDDSLCLPVATEFNGFCQEVQQCTKAKVPQLFRCTLLD
ncbi:hypothetical protein AAG570_002960 [Ranatra chinensis]|uniref:EGF-like domain-containing protein n=1 Tax=Ranatra chinensis TaxID=642074 RepID=A0ABD0YS47_9HEMI